MPCMTEAQCNAGSACMGGICVAPSQALVGMAIEIQPTPGALAHRRLHRADHRHRPQDARRAPEVPMEAVESVKLAFTAGTNAPVPVPASVVYTLASSIPRRPPLMFESVLLSVNDPALLPLPANLSSRARHDQADPTPRRRRDHPAVRVPRADREHADRRHPHRAVRDPGLVARRRRRRARRVRRAGVSERRARQQQAAARQRKLHAHHPGRRGGGRCQRGAGAAFRVAALVQVRAVHPEPADADEQPRPRDGESRGLR